MIFDSWLMWLYLMYEDQGDLDYFDKDKAEDVQVGGCDTEKEALLMIVAALRPCCMWCSDDDGFVDRLDEKL